jgi:hypothetical protein
MSSISQTASCACGALEVAVTGSAGMHGLCHCNNCKRRTGSAFGISAYFRRLNFKVTKGESSIYRVHQVAENIDQERHFCPACGSTVFWYNSAQPDMVGIAAGCLQPDIGAPRYSTSHSNRAEWLGLPEHLKIIE